MLTHAVYGAPPRDLCEVPKGAQQFSPLVPGARSLEELSGALASVSMLAPPGTVERRYALACFLRALAPGAPGTVLAPKDKGGSRLAKELRAFGCEAEEDARAHHRICAFRRPENPVGLDDAIAEGSPRFDEGLGLWTQPGAFSWNRVDAGSALLLEHLPPLAGHGADLGCGLGVLARKILESKAVKRLHLLDIDGRAVRCARKNLPDARATFLWADLRESDEIPAQLDFVVSNPPFHDGGIEDQSLGLAFIQRASYLLKPNGVCWLVANRHLPYETMLRSVFSTVNPCAEAGGFKIFEAHR